MASGPNQQTLVKTKQKAKRLPSGNCLRGPPKLKPWSDQYKNYKKQMLKPTSLWRDLFYSTRRRRLERVFFAVYTRAGAYVSARRVRVGSTSSRRQLFGSLLLGLAMLISLGLSLTHPPAATGGSQR